MKKASVATTDASRSEFAALEQLPNIGPAIAADLRLLGIARPQDLLGRDPFVMYEQLCRMTKKRHDPCLLDTFIAAVRFMSGEPPKPWWAYTKERKRQMEARNLGSSSRMASGCG
ncbi:MAG TPA: helix-hairpin-helix domain-containing protein [Gemmataceae bacterium]|nr:helix-hairpin-helix domain-containing protein [Gemmataceae bacterium]